VNGPRAPKVEVFGREGTLNLPKQPHVDGGRGNRHLTAWTRPGPERLRDSPDCPLDPAQQRVDNLKRALLADHLADAVAGTTPNVDRRGCGPARDWRIMLQGGRGGQTGVHRVGINFTGWSSPHLKYRQVRQTALHNREE